MGADDEWEHEACNRGMDVTNIFDDPDFVCTVRNEINSVVK